MTILPRLKEYGFADGVFTVGRTIKLCGDASDLTTGSNLIREYFSSYNVPAVFTDDEREASIIAKKITDDARRIGYYEAEVRPNRITVRYTDASSFRNAAATLIALLYRNGNFYIDCCDIEDYANYAYRGYMLDLARKYVGIDEIRQQIVLLARAKFTVLHLHLLDTERYAIVSEAVPALNENPLFRQYTKDEMRGLVEYASSLGITIIPEIDLPGHGLYLLEKLPETRCVKDGEKIGIWDMCVAAEETYRYVDLLVGEIVGIFPSEYIHLGGDELSFYDMKDSGYWPNWYECDRCKALAEKEGFTSASDYYCYFVRRVYDIVKNHGRKLMIWNDSIDISKSPDLPRDILIHFWRVAVETRGPHDGCSMQRFLEEGFKVVNSFYEELYADEYIVEERFAKWVPSSSPECADKYSGGIVGAEICAWGVRNHFDYTLPVNLLIFADRAYRGGELSLPEARAALVKQLVSDEKGFVNVFDLLGGAIMPLDGIKKYLPQATSDRKQVEEAIEKLTRRIIEGRGNHAFLRGIIDCLEQLRNDLK